MTDEKNQSGPLPDRLVVDAAGAGKRIDVFLRDRLTGTSRTIIREEIAAGRVLMEGRRLTKSRLLREGDEIDLADFRDRRAEEITPDPEGNLPVIHEAAGFVVVDKEAGLPTLPRDADDTAALACRLVAKYPELAHVGGRFEAGLVHRLDTMTSGLLVAARNEETWRRFRGEWRLRRVDKEYFALVRGVVKKSFTILQSIAHHPRSARRMIISPTGKSAESRVRPIQSRGKWSLVSVSLREGRRHQIRLHLSDIDIPVAGDPVYGESAEKDGVPRLMLHALWLKFRSNEGEGPAGYISPPPDDFTAAIRKRLGESGVEAMKAYRAELLRRR